MNASELRRRKEEIVERYGPWTAHNLDLGSGVYTIHPGVAGGNEARLRRIVQLIESLSDAPTERLRVLDLGALEGLFAVELARRGATVVAVEGRKANLEKMRFARDALELDNLDVRQGDIRDLSPASIGQFDAVLCLGLLYHLDAVTVFDLIGTMQKICRSVAIVETRFAPEATDRWEHASQSYWGEVVPEPQGAEPLSATTLWSSIGNSSSFVLTRPSLCNALVDAGFTSVLECHAPPLLSVNPRRLTFVARNDPRVQILSVPALNEQEWERLDEPARTPRVPARIAGRLAGRVRRAGRRMVDLIARRR